MARLLCSRASTFRKLSVKFSTGVGCISVAIHIRYNIFILFFIFKSRYLYNEKIRYSDSIVDISENFRNSRWYSDLLPLLALDVTIKPKRKETKTDYLISLWLHLQILRKSIYGASIKIFNLNLAWNINEHNYLVLLNRLKLIEFWKKMRKTFTILLQKTLN